MERLTLGDVAFLVFVRGSTMLAILFVDWLNTIRLHCFFSSGLGSRFPDTAGWWTNDVKNWGWIRGATQPRIIPFANRGWRQSHFIIRHHVQRRHVFLANGLIQNEWLHRHAERRINLWGIIRNLHWRACFRVPSILVERSSLVSLGDRKLALAVVVWLVSQDWLRVIKIIHNDHDLAQSGVEKIHIFHAFAGHSEVALVVLWRLSLRYERIDVLQKHVQFRNAPLVVGELLEEVVYLLWV